MRTDTEKGGCKRSRKQLTSLLQCMRSTQLVGKASVSWHGQQFHSLISEESTQGYVTHTYGRKGKKEAPLKDLKKPSGDIVNTLLLRLHTSVHLQDRSIQRWTEINALSCLLWWQHTSTVFLSSENCHIRAHLSCLYTKQWRDVWASFIESWKKTCNANVLNMCLY